MTPRLVSTMLGNVHAEHRVVMTHVHAEEEPPRPVEPEEVVIRATVVDPSGKRRKGKAGRRAPVVVRRAQRALL